jgi:streptogramin lyase
VATEHKGVDMFDLRNAALGCIVMLSMPGCMRAERVSSPTLPNRADVANSLGTLETSQLRGRVTEYTLREPEGSEPIAIAQGPDGALWFTESQGEKIGRITTAGKITTYNVPTRNAVPYGITAGPDGALWFTENNADKVGRITTAGQFTEYKIPTSGVAFPLGITVGSDRALWFVEGGFIGRVTVSGQFSRFPAAPLGWITSGPDGALWFGNGLGSGGGIARLTTGGALTQYPVGGGNVFFDAVGPDQRIWFTQESGCALDSLGAITTAGQIQQYPAPSCSEPTGIAAGPDGAMWFAELRDDHIDRITLSGHITRYKVPSGGAGPFGITAGPDGAMWFTERRANKIGRITTGV